MTALILYPLLCAAAYYLAARAKITRPLWSRYPRWLDEFTLCAACSGFWYGLACGGLGWWLKLPLGGLPPREPATVVIVGLAAIVWTPVVAAAHLRALEGMSGGAGGQA